jgi:hypothetical protein
MAKQRVYGKTTIAHAKAAVSKSRSAKKKASRTDKWETASMTKQMVYEGTTIAHAKAAALKSRSAKKKASLEAVPGRTEHAKA